MTQDTGGGQPTGRRPMSRRQFVGKSAGVAGAALGAWLWVPLLSHAQTTAPPTPTPVANGATPTPVATPKVVQAPAGQGLRGFLEFPQPTQGGIAPLTVTGESTDAAHPNAVELISAALGLSNSTDVGSATSGAGAGKASFEALRITKNVDLTSTSLLMIAGEGSRFPLVNLYLRRGAGPDDQAIYRFQDVFVTTITTASSDDSPRETVDFVFGAMEINYPGQTVEGAPATADWSVVQNQPVFGVGP